MSADRDVITAAGRGDSPRQPGHPGAGSAAWARVRAWAAWFAPENPAGAKNYRPDIDALRAVAVLLVIAYHLGSRRWTGGFIGVDVFFVISGYLIGSLILGEMAAGRFSITGFYGRRIRRIMPALIAVLIATTVAGYFCLYPKPYREYGLSLAAAVASLSNIYFWRTTGYLVGVGTSTALLHTWSLAVEEQFYILLPPFLMLIRRFAPQRLTLCVAAAALLSFVASVIGVSVDANTAFYLPHTRAWELLLGVLVALGATPRLSSAWLRAATALAGLALIAGSAMLMDRDTPFPGLAALPPCLGAAMVIAAHLHGDSLVRRALSLKPIVFVGLISYSLYLWHWPIIILGQEFLLLGGEHAGMVQTLSVVGLTFLLATLTWLFVERPFRRAPAPRWAVFAIAGAAVSVLGLTGLGLYFGQGLPGRFTPEVTRAASYLDYSSDAVFRTGTCFLNTRYHFADFKPAVCLATSRTRPNVLLIGDSYAAHLYYGLDHVLTGDTVLQATSSGCKPSVNDDLDKRDCAQMARYVFRQFLPKHPVDLLVISGFWTEPEFVQLGEVLDWAKARGLPVVVVGRVTEYDSPLPGLIAQGLRRGDPGFVARHQLAEPPVIDRKLAVFAARHGARYASTYQALCPGGVCQHTTAEGVPLQFDHGHLTREGSMLVIGRLASEGAFRIGR